jgi:hypothetical protein
MIARIWHGVTAAAKATEYAEYLKVFELSDYPRPMATGALRITTRRGG